MSFSSRYEEDFAAKTWQYRWWLIDGYLSILFLLAFVAIAFLWRPTGQNRRLAMSTELAQDEDDADGRDAEAYDLESMERNIVVKDEVNDEGGIRLHGGEESLQTPLGDDNVVFEIGDEDDDENSSHPRRGAWDANGGYDIEDDKDEGQGLIGTTKSPQADKRID